jgi:hypothetical protein
MCPDVGAYGAYVSIRLGATRFRQAVASWIDATARGAKYCGVVAGSDCSFPLFLSCFLSPTRSLSLPFTLRLISFVLVDTYMYVPVTFDVLSY